MITWTNELNIRINYIDQSDSNNKKVKAKELLLTAGTKIKHTTMRSLMLRIEIPGTDLHILVDPYYMKEACEKAIKLRDI